MTGPDSRYGAAELAAAAGVRESDARRFFRALGLPDPGGEAGYGAADRDALVALTTAVRDAGLDLDTGIRLIRAIGQNVARMSDWQAAALATRSGDDDPARRAAEARIWAHDVGGALEHVLTFAWNRHLGAALDRLGPTPETDGLSVQASVGFADLVAFSSLSNELDSHRLGELVEIFESRAADVIAAYDGRLVKTLGDSVLFLTEDPAAALSIAWGLIEVIGDDRRLPDVSVGVATGTVVLRLGDVFGPPVNLAARLTALARRNRVLTDDATVDALPRDAYDTVRLTARPVRGFGLLEPVAIRRR